MKKHLVCLSCAALSLFIFTGCGKVNEDKNNSESSSIVPGYDYTVSSEVYSKDEVSIEYPKLSGINNDSQDLWNKKFKETALNEAGELTSEDKYETKYEIKTRKDNFLSILVSGYRFNEGDAYPSNFLYTYNIDITKGTSKRLEDNENISEYAERIFNGEGYTLENDIFADNFREYILQNYKSSDEIKRILSGYDFSRDNDNDRPNGFSYYDNEKIVICMEVPHDVGDYVKLIMD